MKSTQPEWHPLGVLAFWAAVGCWLMFVSAFFSSPGGLAGGIIELTQAILEPMHLTMITNSFAMVGAYTITRLLIGFRVGMKDLSSELFALVFVTAVALTGWSLAGARCDIFVFCAEDLPSSSNCEGDWDRQGRHCR